MELYLKKSIESIRNSLKDANKYFYEEIYRQSYHENPTEIQKYCIDKAFIELLIIIDALGFGNTHKEFNEFYEKAKNHKEGLTYSTMGEDEPYLVWPGEIRKYLNAIANITNTETEELFISHDLIEIIRHSVYSISDTKIYSSPPIDERELHDRIESILKCVYPDLLREPTLPKQIKNFRPDTGIPSLKTLIEYKYISNLTECKRIVDEVLADTRGYKARDWNKFLFVIYETKRIKHEKDWKQMIRECGTAENTEIIVLSGVPSPKKQKRTKK